MACPQPPAVCFISCQPVPIYAMPMAPCPPPQHHQPPPPRQEAPPSVGCCRSCGPPPSQGHHGGGGGGGGHHPRPNCICYPGPVSAGLPSSHNGNIGHRNANGERNEKCPTCDHGSAKETMNAIQRPERPSDYGAPGALSTPGAGCKGPPCLTRGVCPAPCQPQFPPMLPCCPTKCPPGPCPTPGTSLMVGMMPPEPKCQPCCGKPPGCSPASEFPHGNPGPCEPCLWPPLCLRS